MLTNDDKVSSRQSPIYSGTPTGEKGVVSVIAERVDVVLLCGGRGTRFLSVTRGEIPKPLYRLDGIELIQYSINSIDFSLVNKLIFAVDYHAKELEDWINACDFPCEVRLSTQKKHGVLNAVQSALRFIETENFIVCNTDEVREGLRMRDLIKSHSEQPSSLVTLSTTYSNRLHERRVINRNREGLIKSTEYRNLLYKAQPDRIKEVNAGFALFDLSAADYFSEIHGKDWDGMIEPLIQARLARAYVMPEVVYFNVGTDNELDMACRYFAEKKERVVAV